MRMGACYGENNMDDLMKPYAETGQCSQNNESESVQSLGVDNFFPLIGLIIVMCTIAVLWEFMHESKKVGEVRSGRENRALALMRLEHLTCADATFTADGAAVTPKKPEWAEF